MPFYLLSRAVLASASLSLAQASLPVAVADPAGVSPETTVATQRWLPAERNTNQPSAEVLGAPKIVTTSWGPALEFDGKSDALAYPANPLVGLRTFTIQMLVRPLSDGPFEQRFLHIQDPANRRLLFELRLDQSSKRWCLDTHMYLDKPRSRTLIDWNKLHASDEWHWVAMSYDGTAMRSYVDGVPQGELAVAFEPMEPGRFSLGMRLDKRSYFRGQIRELRVDPYVLPLEKLQRKER